MSESLVVDDSEEYVCLKLSPRHSTVHPLIPIVVIASCMADNSEYILCSHWLYHVP